ncbi:hypothetical protein B0H16DRAFT_1564200 [Mycena metata]|uniref:Uncharacterized protein n=1 Tax=Mycena metata TaxID=1033252 RepID=A0AAD7N1B8_9AGAR|nr:hypothetical protein B0H16DRAFT_1564200 [Mycena metata]
MCSPMSTFTPYAEPGRERERERGREGARFTAQEGGRPSYVNLSVNVNVGYGTTPFTAVGACSNPRSSRTSTCRHRRARWCSTRRGTLRRSPPHLLLQQFRFAAAADDTPPDASLLTLHVPAPAARALDDEPARVAVRAPARAVFARGDAAAAAAFVLCFVISLFFGDLFFGDYGYFRRCR